jgi:hypothetical protein
VFSLANLLNLTAMKTLAVLTMAMLSASLPVRASLPANEAPVRHDIAVVTSNAAEVTIEVYDLYTGAMKYRLAREEQRGVHLAFRDLVCVDDSVFVIEEIDNGGRLRQIQISNGGYRWETCDGWTLTNDDFDGAIVRIGRDIYVADHWATKHPVAGLIQFPHSKRSEPVRWESAFEAIDMSVAIDGSIVMLDRHHRLARYLPKENKTTLLLSDYALDAFRPTAICMIDAKTCAIGAASGQIRFYRDGAYDMKETIKISGSICDLDLIDGLLVASTTSEPGVHAIVLDDPKVPVRTFAQSYEYPGFVYVCEVPHKKPKKR